jgi:ribonuclease-3
MIVEDLLQRLRSVGVNLEPLDGGAPRCSSRAGGVAPSADPGSSVDLPSSVDPKGFAHLEEALTHPSFANEQRRGRRADNQRLEFLGDAVLGLFASELLMDRFPTAKEGELSLMRSLLVNTEALAAWARSIDLGKALRFGRGADAAGERERDSVLADAVEALVGAIYLDRGIDVARRLSSAIVAEPLSRLASAPAVGRDPKSELQEQVQAEGGPSPRYRVVGAEGPDHRRAFIVVVEVSGEVLGEGRGRSKKLAEQAAARSALQARERAQRDRLVVLGADARSSSDVVPSNASLTSAALTPSGDPE